MLSKAVPLCNKCVHKVNIPDGGEVSWHCGLHNLAKLYKRTGIGLPIAPDWCPLRKENMAEQKK